MTGAAGHAETAPRPVLATSEPVMIPMAEGRFLVRAWQIPDADGTTVGEHLSLTASGQREDISETAPLVRLHSECLTGDVFGSRRCDCGDQLSAALDYIEAKGRGVVIYLRGHEGRGIGLLPKLRAYVLQDEGLDTVDANLEQGLPVDAREYSAAAQILKDLQVQAVALISNNPDKIHDLASHGVNVTKRIPVELNANEDNVVYLRTKRDRMGHQLDTLD